MTEARNLRNMTMAQTPLLGDENTPLHMSAMSGTGFEGATPRHAVPFTPNPLTTPSRAGQIDMSPTPRSDLKSMVAVTPLRTPMRDNLSINASDRFSGASMTPRDVASARSMLRSGFLALPRPENNFEVLVPEDDDATTTNPEATTEDAASRDTRLKRMREEEVKRDLARRSQAVQLSLPRPAIVDVERLLKEMTTGDNDVHDLVQARQLITSELVQLLQHDSLTHPMPGTSQPGGTQSTYVIADDAAVATAKLEIRQELAASFGYPDAHSDQMKEGFAALASLEARDESIGWAHARRQLTFDSATKRWRDLGCMAAAERVAGYTSSLESSRASMVKEATKAAKAEKKLGVTLGGYQSRSKTLLKKIADAFQDLQQSEIDLASFSQLQTNEFATGPRRITCL
jgi:pre-mRNA-splicing factor CDC5/CEF1